MLLFFGLRGEGEGCACLLEAAEGRGQQAVVARLVAPSARIAKASSFFTSPPGPASDISIAAGFIVSRPVQTGVTEDDLRLGDVRRHVEHRR